MLTQNSMICYLISDCITQLNFIKDLSPYVTWRN